MIACAVALDPQQVAAGLCWMLNGQVDEESIDSDLGNDIEPLLLQKRPDRALEVIRRPFDAVIGTLEFPTERKLDTA